MADELATSHLQPDDLAAWLTAGPRATDGARIRTHLAECDECRGEAIEVSRLVRADARGTRWPVAALALAAGVVLAVWFGARSPEPAAVLRNSTSESALAAAAVPLPLAPIGSVTRSGAPFFFTWRSWPGSVEYRITLLDPAGSVLWTQTLADTTIALPLAVSLAPSETYFWYVDALQPDGTSATSGAQAFVLTP